MRVRHRFNAVSLVCLTTVLASTMAIPADAAAPIPNPCSLVTAAEMQKLVGPLKVPPRATDPATGEITCSFEPATGPSYVDVSLHDGELSAWKASSGGKNPLSLPELGKDAFVNPDPGGYTDLFAKKGALVLHVSLPTASNAVATAKAIAKLALSVSDGSPSSIPDRRLRNRHHTPLQSAFSDGRTRVTSFLKIS